MAPIACLFPLYIQVSGLSLSCVPVSFQHPEPFFSPLPLVLETVGFPFLNTTAASYRAGSRTQSPPSSCTWFPEIQRSLVNISAFYRVTHKQTNQAHFKRIKHTLFIYFFNFILFLNFT